MAKMPDQKVVIVRSECTPCLASLLPQRRGRTLRTPFTRLSGL